MPALTIFIVFSPILINRILEWTSNISNEIITKWNLTSISIDFYLFHIYIYIDDFQKFMSSKKSDSIPND